MRYDLPTSKSFIFLFLGAAILRKGIDILLEAYQKAFRREDDVCLVIKDHTADVFYGGQSFKEKIEKVMTREEAPEIIYVDKYLPPEELTKLIQTCNVGVFPYRAEGFARPILELMAAGKPCLVPDFGACKDYCSAENSFLLPVQRIHLPVFNTFTYNTLGFSEEIEFCEVDPSVLAEEMRKAAKTSRAELNRRGRRASRVGELFTWKQTAASALTFLQELV
jgi:glycosyltransferase involved in cell wall biosynthesis